MALEHGRGERGEGDRDWGGTKRLEGGGIRDWWGDRAAGGTGRYQGGGKGTGTGPGGRMGRSNRDGAKPENWLDRAVGWTRRMAEPGDRWAPWN